MTEPGLEARKVFGVSVAPRGCTDDGSEVVGDTASESAASAASAAGAWMLVAVAVAVTVTVTSTVVVVGAAQEPPAPAAAVATSVGAGLASLGAVAPSATGVGTVNIVLTTVFSMVMKLIRGRRLVLLAASAAGGVVEVLVVGKAYGGATVPEATPGCP